MGDEWMNDNLLLHVQRDVFLNIDIELSVRKV